MNSQGRHYRDPEHGDTSDPVCDYVAKDGTKCDFFTDPEHRSLEYPDDVSVGPVVTDNGTAPNSDVSAIFHLLQQQKLDNEVRNAQLKVLQEQVTALTHRAPMPSVRRRSSSQPPPTAPPAPSYSAPTLTQPFVVPPSASSITTQPPGLIPQHNLGFTGLNMPQMVSSQNMFNNEGMTTSTTSIYSPANPLTGNPLTGNPLSGMGAATGTLYNQKSQVTSVDQLYAATTVNKQLRAYEFAATGQFPYKSQLKQDNCNAISFAYGSFKHLEAAKLGLVSMSENEFLARLRHLKNVFEVACLSSNLSSFTDPAWQVAREYDSRVIADIESGAKTWDKLSGGLETDAIYVAKETVELKNKIKRPKDQKDSKKPKDPKDPKGNGCTTYNTHRSSDGCYWEHVNKGESCVFEHFCSWCKTNRDSKEKHKLINCEFKSE